MSTPHWDYRIEDSSSSLVWKKLEAHETTQAKKEHAQMLFFLQIYRIGGGMCFLLLNIHIHRK